MQKVNLYNQPIEAIGPSSPPLFIKVATKHGVESTLGSYESAFKTHTYVLYDVLPEELRTKIKLVIEALTAGM